MSAEVELQNVSIAFGNFYAAKNVNVKIGAGEFFSFLGPSGCGKTTLLRAVSGFLEPSQGKVLIDGQDMSGIGPNKRPTSLIFQNLALFPLMSVADNIAFSLEVRGHDKTSRRKRADELLDLVALNGQGDKKVHELSGGQKQRVAIAKALASQPEILLLDEPFSHIDSYKKRSLRRSLFSYLKSNEITCVVASHDRDDVLPFADSIVVVESGKIISSGTPEDLYKNPVLPKIAAFFSEFSLVNGEIYYTNQIKIVQDSEYKAIVSKSYFNGEGYIIQAEFESQTVLINNPEPIDKNETIKILFDK